MKPTYDELKKENLRLQSAVTMADALNQAAQEAISRFMDGMEKLHASMTPEQQAVKAELEAVATKFDVSLGSWRPTNGALLIAEERRQQLTREGYTPKHDDEHAGGEFITAAESYCAAGQMAQQGSTIQEIKDYVLYGSGEVCAWPWEENAFKPSADPIRNLVKAGALIAAEIDRLQRKQVSDEVKQVANN